ncbi:MAG TPA: hypothetical protein VK869_01760 [Rubrobacteraceae bacterium]|nr:hypothetical protein [Rubrobacteraceae bacterium]
MLAAIVVALAGILVAQGPASAHDHRIPETVLMKGKQKLQEGRKVRYSDWFASTGGGECVHAHADYAFGFPEIERKPHIPSVDAGSKLKVRIYKSQKPRPFNLARVDKDGNPTREVSVNLKPVIRNEKRVAWDAVFRVDRPDTRYRLVSEGYWNDREDCGGKQHAFWSFQVKTGGAS